jgi:glycosyltransferase involved in cell wall biosynthesis
MTPTVSVVIATYNYARFLPQALDSVLRQTFQDFEVIVLDDGSTDGTDAVVARYLGDKRIRYRRAQHLGQPRAKNAGLREAHGRLIAFLDADDAWLPTKLERQVNLFRRDRGLGVACTDRRWVNEQGFEVRTPHVALYRGYVLRQLFRYNFVCFSSSMVHRRVFQDVGAFDERLELAIDYDLWLRAARRYRFDYVDEALVNYRVGHANLSRRLEERLRTILRIRRHFLDELGGRLLLPGRLVRRASAEAYSALGLVVRDRSRLTALGWYGRALASAPLHGLAWKGLASLLLPESSRRLVRRALGKPIDWRVREPVVRGQGSGISTLTPDP